MPEYRLTPDAEEDLKEIARYLGQELEALAEPAGGLAHGRQLHQVGIEVADAAHALADRLAPAHGLDHAPETDAHVGVAATVAGDLQRLDDLAARAVQGPSGDARPLPQRWTSSIVVRPAMTFSRPSSERSTYPRRLACANAAARRPKAATEIAGPDWTDSNVQRLETEPSTTANGSVADEVGGDGDHRELENQAGP